MEEEKNDLAIRIKELQEEKKEFQEWQGQGLA